MKVDDYRMAAKPKLLEKMGVCQLKRRREGTRWIFREWSRFPMEELVFVQDEGLWH